jgi:AraC-like DNA-binding protein
MVKNMYSNFDISRLSVSFQAMVKNPEMIYQFIEVLPFSTEVFDPDGTLAFCNNEFLRFNNVSDVNSVVGKYNVLNDPVCDKLFGHEELVEMMRGEAKTWMDIPAPIQDLVDRGAAPEKPFESAYMDVYARPLWDGDKLAYVICIFIVKRVYVGRPEITRAQDYIEQHWQEEFDVDEIAKAANLSRRHLQRIYKEVTNEAPKDTYTRLKIDKLKEKLLDPNLNITEAFAACGVDYGGRWLNTFKNMVGQSPSEFRIPK